METKGGSQCQLGQTFFGLQAEDRIRIHSELFEISYHSNGSIPLFDAYELPISLRYFYLKCLIEAKKKENAANNPSDSDMAPSRKIAKPF